MKEASWSEQAILMPIYERMSNSASTTPILHFIDARPVKTCIEIGRRTIYLLCFINYSLHWLLTVRMGLKDGLYENKQ
jgi:hypothetical protein